MVLYKVSFQESFYSAVSLVIIKGIFLLFKNLSYLFMYSSYNFLHFFTLYEILFFRKETAHFWEHFRQKSVIFLSMSLKQVIKYGKYIFWCV